MSIVAFQKRTAGFTMVELLICIAIIALLLGILLPVLSLAKASAKSISCQSQLRQIGNSISLYVQDNRGFLSLSRGGVKWTAIDPATGQLAMINPMASTAYWGAPYAPYLLPKSSMNARGALVSEITRSAATIWHCPSTVSLAPISSDPTQPLSYGINGFITSFFKIDPVSLQKVFFWRKPTMYRNPSQVIVVQDSLQPLINFQIKDTLSDYNSGMNLTNWRPGGSNYAVSMGVAGFYRHLNRCNILWLDGHVDQIAQSFGADVPAVWYQPPTN